MRGLYQSSYVNPAFAPKYKVSVGLPVISNFHITNTRTGFTMQDVFDCVDSDSLLDFNKFYNKIDGAGIGIQTTMNTDLFHVSFPIGKVQMSVNTGLRTQNTEVISKAFFGFLANGNAYFAGQSQDVDLMKITATNYTETGVSAQRQFGKFSVGVRAKYLQGIAAVQSDALGFTITTGANPYDTLKIRTRGNLRTAGVPLFADSVTNQPKNDDLKQFNAADLTKFANTGFGIDLGLTYQVTPRLMVHGSVVDWGGINWRSNPYHYALTGKEVRFGGFSNNDFNSDSTRQAFTDSLTKLLYQSTVTTESFRTKLLTRYYVGGDFDLTKRDKVGILYQGQQFPNKLISAYTISYAHKFGRVWDLSANYSRYGGKYSQVGVGTAVKMGPVQLYVITDDILILFKPNNYNYMYFRMGINLVFGDLSKVKKVIPNTEGAPSTPRTSPAQ
jgi:hypothetical protein